MQIFGFEVWTLAATGIAWLAVSYLFWKLVAGPMMKKWIKSTIINMLSTPDKETTFAINAIFGHGWNWFITPAKTGNKVKVKDETGEIVETDEIKSPYEMIIAESTRMIFNKFKASKGGATAQLGNALVDQDGGLSALMGMGMGPRKGQSTLEWGFEQLIARKGDEIANLVMKKLKSGQTDSLDAFANR